MWPAPPDDTTARWASSFPRYLQAEDPAGDGFCTGDDGDEGTARDAMWDAVRTQARQQAVDEPVLSSMLYASVLAHNTLPAALAFVLANRLSDTTLLAPQLAAIFEAELSRPEVERAVHYDLEALLVRDPACRDPCSGLLHLKGFHAVQAHRCAHALWHRGKRQLALMLQSRVSEVLGVDTHPGARFGHGVLIDHGEGVVIGETAVLGNNVSIMQGVTLGGTGKAGGDRHPKIHAGVLIGPMATVIGNVQVETGAAIAAGSLILKEVPEFTMWAGVPAKQVGVLPRGALPSIDMCADIEEKLSKTFCDDWEKAVAAADRDRDRSLAPAAEAAPSAAEAGEAAAPLDEPKVEEELGPGSLVEVIGGMYKGSRGRVRLLRRSGSQARVRLPRYGSSVESTIDVAQLRMLVGAEAEFYEE